MTPLAVWERAGGRSNGELGGGGGGLAANLGIAQKEGPKCLVIAKLGILINLSSPIIKTYSDFVEQKTVVL